MLGDERLVNVFACVWFAWGARQCRFPVQKTLTAKNAIGTLCHRSLKLPRIMIIISCNIKKSCLRDSFVAVPSLKLLVSRLILLLVRIGLF